MNEPPAWLWLAGALLIETGIILAIFPIVYAVLTIRRFRSFSGMKVWAEINILGLMLGFFPPFGIALSIQGAAFIGHDLEPLLKPVIYISIPILAPVVVSSFIRLIWSGLSRSQSSHRKAGSNKSGDSSLDRTESK